MVHTWILRCYVNPTNPSLFDALAKTIKDQRQVNNIHRQLISDGLLFTTAMQRSIESIFPLSLENIWLWPVYSFLPSSLDGHLPNRITKSLSRGKIAMIPAVDGFEPEPSMPRLQWRHAPHWHIWTFRATDGMQRRPCSHSPIPNSVRLGCYWCSPGREPPRKGQAKVFGHALPLTLGLQKKPGIFQMLIYTSRQN